MGEATRQVGRAVFWSVFARAGRFVLGLASSVIVVRGLGEHDYGVLSLVRSVLAFVIAITSAGLGQSVLKFLPVLRVARDRGQARVLVRRVFAIQTLAWLLLLLVTAGLSGRADGFFDMAGIGSMLIVAVCLALFELFFTLISHVLNAHYDTKLLSIANIASHVVFIIGLLVAIPRGWGVIGVLATGAAGQFVGSLLVIGSMRRHLSGDGPPVVAGEAVGGAVGRGRLLRFSLPFALIGVLNVIVWRQSETILIAHFRTAAETGFFDLAYRLPQTMLEFVPGAVWPIILAGFSEAYARDTANLRTAIDRYYRMLFLLSTPICITGVALGGRMVPILFGDNMSAAAMPTQIFFGIFTVSFFGTPLSMSLYVMEKSHLNLLVIFFLAVVNVGLDLLLIPRFGVVGAVVPVALVIVMTPFIYKRIVDRIVGGVEVPYRYIGRCFAASSPVLLLLPLSGLIRGVPQLILAAVVAAVIVLLGTKKLKLIGKAESDMLGSIPIPAVDRILKFISA